MLQQEINLYRFFAAPVTDAEFLTWKRYWIANALFASFMVIILLLSISDNYYLKQRLNLAQAKMAEYQAQFQKLKGSFPQFFFGENINDAVTSLKNEMAAQKQIIGILSMHNAFSQNLISFSRTIVPNVWLTKISIEKNGDDITLQGESIGMNSMHNFISNLEKDKIYTTYTTTLKKISNEDVKDPATKLSFELNMVKNSDG